MDINKEKWFKKIWEVFGFEGGGRKLLVKDVCGF